MKRLRQRFATFRNKNNTGTPPPHQQAGHLDNVVDGLNGHVEYFTNCRKKRGRSRTEYNTITKSCVSDDDVINGLLTSRSEINLACGTRNAAVVCGMNIIQVNNIDNASRMYSINIGTGEGSSFTLEETGKILQYNIYRPLSVATDAFHVSMLDSGSLNFGSARGFVKNSGIIMKCDIFDAELLSSKIFDLRLRSTGPRDPIIKIKFWNRIPNLTLRINGGAIKLPVSNKEHFDGDISCQSLVLRAPMVVFLGKINCVPVTHPTIDESDSPENERDQ